MESFPALCLFLFGEPSLAHLHCSRNVSALASRANIAARLCLSLDPRLQRATRLIMQRIAALTGQEAREDVLDPAGVSGVASGQR